MRKVPPQIAERLPAAADLFADAGLDNTKIDDVAAATGIAKATLYYYFAGKEDILSFLLEDTLSQIAAEVAATVAGQGTGAERLAAVISAQLRVMARQPAVCRALISELGRAARIPVIAGMIATAYLQPVETLLIAGATDGSLVEQPDPRLAATAVFGAVNTCAMTYLVEDGTFDVDHVARTVHSIVIDGLRPR